MPRAARLQLARHKKEKKKREKKKKKRDHAADGAEGGKVAVGAA